MLGYDRRWNRYWLLRGSCPDAVTEDDSPASSWVYVEHCQLPAAESKQAAGAFARAHQQPHLACCGTNPNLSKTLT